MSSESTTTHEVVNTALVEALTGLSGKYGAIHRRLDGTLISNDDGGQRMIARLQRQGNCTVGGIGIFIGSGGMLSWLPELNLDAAVLIDINSAVPELNGTIESAVTTATAPEKAIRTITQPDVQERHIILRELHDFYGGSKSVLSHLEREARHYGSYHWTQTLRFGQVQAALTRTPTAYVAADMANRDFGKELRIISEYFNLPITFVNFTNVHQMIHTGTMDFLKRWPLANDATILFSMNKEAMPGDWPQMEMAGGLDAYLADVHEEIVKYH